MPAYIIRFTPAEGGSEVPMALPATTTLEEASKVMRKVARESFDQRASLWAGVQLPETGGVHDVLPRRCIGEHTAKRWRASVTWPETNEVRDLRWYASGATEAAELSQSWGARQGIKSLSILQIVRI